MRNLDFSLSAMEITKVFAKGVIWDGSHFKIHWSSVWRTEWSGKEE